MYGYAQALQTGNVGYQPYTGPVVADVDPSVSQGLGMQSGLASSQWGGPGEQALYNAQALGNQFIGQGGLSPTAQQALGGLGQTADQYGQIFGAGQEPGGIYRGIYDATAQPWSQYQQIYGAGQEPADVYRGIESAAAQPWTQYQQIFNAAQLPANIYRQLYTQSAGEQNPYLPQVLNTIQDRIGSGMSGAGRYGSAAYDAAIAQGMASPLLQDYQARQQMMAQAGQGLQNVLAGQMGATQGMLGVLGEQGAAGQGLQNVLAGQMGATQGMLGTLGEQGAAAQGLQNMLAGQMGATQGLGQTYGQIAGLGQGGMQAAGQWAQNMPGFMQGQYLPAQQTLATGQYMQDRAQQELQGQIALYNAQQAYPWQQLERQAAIMAGAGQLGGTQVTAQTPQQAPTLQRLLGGALVGGGLGSSFGPVGTGLGALGGAGLGYFL
jgi:hypothetical protein